MIGGIGWDDLWEPDGGVAGLSFPMGFEREVSVVAWKQDGSQVPVGEVAGLFLETVKSKWPCLSTDHYSNGGVFGEGGWALYIDSGAHPEYSSAECIDLKELVDRQIASEMICSDIADEILRSHGGYNGSIEEIVLYNNVACYKKRSVFGFHESYGYSRKTDPDLVYSILPAYLMSRDIICGSGGFDPMSSGAEFMLNNKVSRITILQSTSSTGYDRPLVHKKNESMDGSLNRLHIICGSAPLGGHCSSFLRYGMTSLVLRLIDLGRLREPPAVFFDPIRCLNTFNRDPSCTATVHDEDGRPWTAVSLQRYFLSLARKYVDELPDYASEVITVGEGILDRLEKGGYKAVARTLDWAMKFWALTEVFLPDINFPLRMLKPCKYVADKLTTATQHAVQQSNDTDINYEKDISWGHVMGPWSPVRSTVKLMRRYLEGQDIPWYQFVRYVGEDIPGKLKEFDLVFSMFYSKSGPGIFKEMDAAGILDHRIEGIGERVELAMVTPPSTPRARARGRCVTRYARYGDRYVCRWDRVIDTKSSDKRYLDLSDPFTVPDTWLSEGGKPVRRVVAL